MKVPAFHEIGSTTARIGAASQPVFTHYKLLEIERPLFAQSSSASMCRTIRIAWNIRNVGLRVQHTQAAHAAGARLLRTALGMHRRVCVARMLPLTAQRVRGLLHTGIA
jgi:hypothetical protein